MKPTTRIVRRRPARRLSPRFSGLELGLCVLGGFMLVGVTLGTKLQVPTHPEAEHGDWSPLTLLLPGLIFLAAGLSYAVRGLLRRRRERRAIVSSQESAA